MNCKFRYLIKYQVHLLYLNANQNAIVRMIAKESEIYVFNLFFANILGDTNGS